MPCKYKILLEHTLFNSHTLKWNWLCHKSKTKKPSQSDDSRLFKATDSPNSTRINSFHRHIYLMLEVTAIHLELVLCRYECEDCVT